MEVVLFEVNGQAYGMSIDYLEGIEELENITPVANAPSYITGISNVRGEIVPVYDLAKKFMLESSEKPGKYLLVRMDGMVVCLAVNEVIGMRNFGGDDSFGLPEVFDIKENYFTGVLKIDEKSLALLIAPDILISNVERKDISDFTSGVE